MADIRFDPPQVALVTGAAGGIGWETVRRYAQAGADVALTDVHDGVLALPVELSAEFPERTFAAFVADTTSESSLRELVGSVEERFGRLDHLALVAGVVQDAATVEEMALEEWDRVMSVNLTGLFLGARAAIPLLRRDGGGTITAIASFWGRSGRPMFAAYCTSKAGVFVLVQSLAAELAPDIRVNSVAPGNINTSMHRFALQREAEERGVTFEEMRDVEWAKVPLRVAGEPSTIADAVVFLSSPAASYITGASLDVNGGVLFH